MGICYQEGIQNHLFILDISCTSTVEKSGIKLRKQKAQLRCKVFFWLSTDMIEVQVNSVQGSVVAVS